MTRFALVVALLLGAFSTADAADYVHGYIRSNGTYVAPHYRSHADGNFYNNWSTYGNVNPYTGAYGTRHYPSYNYGGYGYGSSYYTPSYSTYPTYHHSHHSHHRYGY